MPVKNGKDVNCLKCSKKFHVPQYRLDAGFGKYCSKKCASKGGPVEIICLVCGNKKTVTRTRYNMGLGKYCSKKCSNISQKGSIRPHSKEWEEKRLAAVRANTFKYKGKPNPASKRTIKIALAVLNKKRKEDPEKYAKKAILNLPKDVSGEKNPNFNDWATKKSKSFRTINSSKFDKWRTKVLDRDNHMCRMCGCSGKLDAHHIIPLCQTTITAFLVMNGVSLCRKCHVKTDSFGGRVVNKQSYADDGIGTTMCLARSIPHKFQAYDTVGNYEWTESGVLVIFVSEMGNELYERLVFYHEFIEATMCQLNGIKEKEITDFDIMFEQERVDGLHQNNEEPGDDPRAPYRKWHIFATIAEKKLCQKMNLDWDKYDKTVNSLKW